MSKARTPSALIPAAPRFDRPLLLAISIMAGFAALASIGARTAWSTAGDWTVSLSQSLTVQVRSAAGLTGPETAEEAAAILRSARDVRSVTVMKAEDVAALLTPSLGNWSQTDELPLPGLIDVQIDERSANQVERLTAALRAAGFDARIDDHSGFATSLEGRANALRIAGIVIAASAIAAGVLVTSYAVRASLAARHNVVEILHLFGAYDRYIASEVSRRFLVLGAKAGVIGAIFAGLAIAGFMLATQGDPTGATQFAPSYSPTRLDVAIVGATPFITSIVAAASAHGATLSALRELV